MTEFYSYAVSIRIEKRDMTSFLFLRATRSVVLVTCRVHSYGHQGQVFRASPAGLLHSDRGDWKLSSLGKLVGGFP